MSGKVLIVGERMNAPTWRPRHWPDVACGRYWSAMRRLGAFRDAGSRSKLAKLGVDAASSDCVNLLPPDPQGVPWDAATARLVATAWLPRIREEFDLVLLCGGRVVRAFGVELLGTLTECLGSRVDLGGVGAVLLPHPSGLCRFWNDAGRVGELGRCLESL